MDPRTPWRILAARGWGSALAEATLTLAGIPYQRDVLDPGEPGPDRERLLAANPLGQIPTLILPDGSVLTRAPPSRSSRPISRRTRPSLRPRAPRSAQRSCVGCCS
jgi:hypothetical protein